MSLEWYSRARERELVFWRDVCESRAGLAVLLYKLTSSRPASGMNFTPDKQHDSLSSTSLLYAGHSRRSCAVLGCLLLLLMMMPQNSRMGLHPFLCFARAVVGKLVRVLSIQLQLQWHGSARVNPILNVYQKQRFFSKFVVTKDLIRHFKIYLIKLNKKLTRSCKLN